MTNDGSPTEAFRSNQPKTVYSVRALAEPGVMPRMMDLLSKRGMVPDQWQSFRIGPDGKVLQITFAALDLDITVANHIANCLRQVIGVETVVMSRDDIDLEETTESALSA